LRLRAISGRYIGYWKPYATSHEELGADTAVRQEVPLADGTARRSNVPSER